MGALPCLVGTPLGSYSTTSVMFLTVCFYSNTLFRPGGRALQHRPSHTNGGVSPTSGNLLRNAFLSHSVSLCYARSLCNSPTAPPSAVLLWFV
eukprot:11865160-Heterocapsa_arctica.AAC.1